MHTITAVVERVHMNSSTEWQTRPGRDALLAIGTAQKQSLFMGHQT
jgi:hypothetical protein